MELRCDWNGNELIFQGITRGSRGTEKEREKKGRRESARVCRQRRPETDLLFVSLTSLRLIFLINQTKSVLASGYAMRTCVCVYVFVCVCERESTDAGSGKVVVEK